MRQRRQFYEKARSKVGFTQFFSFFTAMMLSHKANQVTKVREDGRSHLQQNRRRLKETLIRKSRKYSEKCNSDVYLLIADHRGDVIRFFTATFTVDEQSIESFPPPDKSLVCASKIQTYGIVTDKQQDRYYPPPKRITSENYPKSTVRTEKRHQHATSQKTQRNSTETVKPVS